MNIPDRSGISPILILLIMVAALVAGCVGSDAPSGNRDNPPHTPSPVPVGNLSTSPVGWHPGNWIVINPIARQQNREDIFEINGTTSLGIGENLYYTVDREDGAISIPCPTGPAVHCEPMIIVGAAAIANGTIPLVNSGEIGNSWSVLLNTSGPEYRSGYNELARFSVNVSSSDGTIRNSTCFTIFSKIFGPC